MPVRNNKLCRDNDLGEVAKGSIDLTDINSQDKLDLAWKATWLGELAGFTVTIEFEPIKIHIHELMTDDDLWDDDIMSAKYFKHCVQNYLIKKLKESR